MAILEMKNVSYRYRNKKKEVYALKEINLCFESGKIYAIIGKSGSGKSTLLSLLAALDKPCKGDVFYKGKNVNMMNQDEYRCNQISMIHQAYHLLPLATVIENVQYPLMLNKIGKQEAYEIASKYLEMLDIGEAYYTRLPGELSGGEQQRVAIARALVNQGSVILADEPTGNLDNENSNIIFSYLIDLAKTKNYCIIIVTHDLDIAKKCDEVIRIRDSHILK